MMTQQRGPLSGMSYRRRLAEMADGARGPSEVRQRTEEPRTHRLSPLLPHLSSAPPSFLVLIAVWYDAVLLLPRCIAPFELVGLG